MSRVQLLLLLLVGPSLHSTTAELVMVYSIQRHGARNVLPKSALLSENGASGGPTLLPAGQRMCYSAGTAFNRRYISQATCQAARTVSTCLSSPGREAYGVVNTRGVGFSNYNSLASSSALDRTITSANSFLAGVFPSSSSGGDGRAASLESVPVYSTHDSEDWLVRGYAKCPAYQQRLAAWLQSDAFRQKAQQTRALREQVQALAPQLNTSLAQWWDVYDSFSVWRQFGVGNPMPNISNDTFAQVVAVANWLEVSKMAPELTGNLLGGGLLGDMLPRMAAAEAAVAASSSGTQGPNYYKLLTVSSHYNTQLGVLSALQAGAPPSQRTQYLWQDKIPALAAVLAFELHRDAADGQSFVVRAVAQDGPDTPYTTLPLPCAVAGDAAEALAGPGSCTLDRFRALAGPQAVNSSEAWCEACSNNKVMACVVHDMERQLMAVADVVGSSSLSAAGGGGGSSSSGRSGTSPAMVAVWCVLSVAVVAALAGAVVFAARRLRQRKAGSSGMQLQQALSGVHSQPPVSLDRPAPV